MVTSSRVSHYFPDCCIFFALELEHLLQPGHLLGVTLLHCFEVGVSPVPGLTDIKLFELVNAMKRKKIDIFVLAGDSSDRLAVLHF